MSRISGFAAGAHGTEQQAARLADMRRALDGLNRHLATGQRADTLAGLGAQRGTTLDLRAHVAETEALSAGNLRGTQRLTLMTRSLQRFSDLAQAARAGIAQASGVVSEGAVNAAARVAQGRLSEALAVLNTDFDGQFLFSGRAATTEPVLGLNALLEGDGGKAGLRTLIAERRQADVGDGKGRLSTALAGATVSVSETIAGLPFGFTLAGARSAMSGATAGGPSGSPATVTLALTAVPAAGETLAIDLTLPDGSRETLTLTARASGAAASDDGSFLVGADAAATAANLKGALDLTLSKRASTALAAASAMVAAGDFTDASVSTPARRIAGPPFDTATGFAAAGSRPSVTWYSGDDDAAADARASQTAVVDRGLTVGTGARADEPALRRAVAAFAALATESAAPGDAAAPERYAALASRASGQLAGPQQGQEIKDIATELSFAATAMGQARERLAVRQAFFEDGLAGIETPSMEELSAAILTLQTRLQASYQTTASLARLNLADYLR